MKPQKFDNNWLGICGEGLATLHDKNGKIIGTCLDTPNCVAYAMLKHSNIHHSRGILGNRKRDILPTRMHVSNEPQYFEKYININL